MLVITDGARSAIESILAASPAPETSGLRISTGLEDAAMLSLDVAPVPADGDTVLEESGARLFLEPAAAVILDDKVLDAERGPAGGVNFQVALQG